LSEPTVEFENDRVRVSRARQEGAGARSTAPRHDRLIVYLEDSEIARTEGGEPEHHSRRGGDVVWRGASEHEIEVRDDGPHEVLIIELKR
jgi:hypothetical protein